MKAKLILSTIFLVASISLYAQDSSKLTKVFLQDGTTFSAYVEKQDDGGYKLTMEDGSVFLFREGEISLDKPFKKKSAKNTQTTNQVPSPKNLVQGLNYRELKKMYSARDYDGREPGDKYSPAGVGIASFFLPGLGQYITGCQIGWGVVQTCLAIASIPLMTASRSYYHEEYTYGSSGHIYNHTSYSSRVWAAEIAVPAICVWAGMGIWSACSASKAAKIKNLYYRDLKNQVTYKFELSPYVDLTAPVLASNQNMVAGLSFRVSF